MHDSEGYDYVPSHPAGVEWAHVMGLHDGSIVYLESLRAAGVFDYWTSENA